MEKIRRKYNKTIAVKYQYVDSLESEEAVAEVFDDILARLVQKQSDNKREKFDIPLDVMVEESRLNPQYNVDIN